MTETNVFQLAQPGTFADSLTDVLREGARALLAQAVEAEVADFLARHADRTTADGRRRIVRHGHLPERSIMTGIGPVSLLEKHHPQRCRAFRSWTSRPRGGAPAPRARPRRR